MKHFVEITKPAALMLIGNDEKSWQGYEQTERAEISFYLTNGCRIAAVHNWVSNVTQYFIQDINA